METSNPIVHTVFIRRNPEGRIWVSAPHIHMRRAEFIQWVGESGMNWRVEFPTRTPFAESSFDHRRAAPVRPESEAVAEEYKYNIEVDGEVLDPWIVVKEP